MKTPSPWTGRVRDTVRGRGRQVAPGDKGSACIVRQLPRLADALVRATIKAHRLGLIGKNGGDA
jgi:hypothetical protein